MYKDPDRYFSIEIPKNWNTSRSIGYETSTVNGVQIEDHPIYTGSQLNTKTDNKPGVFIVIYPHYIDCKNLDRNSANSFQVNTKLASLPASYSDRFGWFIISKHASFQIQEQVWKYQEDLMFFNKTKPSPTVVPPVFNSANKALADIVIKSFKLAPNDQACS